MGKMSGRVWTRLYSLHFVVVVVIAWCTTGLLSMQYGLATGRHFVLFLQFGLPFTNVGGFFLKKAGWSRAGLESPRAAKRLQNVRRVRMFRSFSFHAILSTTVSPA